MRVDNSYERARASKQIVSLVIAASVLAVPTARTTDWGAAKWGSTAQWRATPTLERPLGKATKQPIRQRGHSARGTAR